MSTAPKSEILRMAELVAYQDGSVVSRQITKADAGNVTLFAFDQDQELSEHASPYDALLHVLDGEAETITRTCIEAAKAGDMTAIRLVLERLLPPAKERPVTCELPDVADAQGVANAQAAILRAVAAGELLPTEGATLAGIVESRRKAIETADLEVRITALENKQ